MRGDIRDWDKALESRVDWGWLNWSWGDTKISPSDIDFIVERHGHFLIGEIKPSAEALPLGQEILLKAYAKLPRTTAFVLSGEIIDHDIRPESLWIVGKGKFNPIDKAGFAKFCRDWREDAEGKNTKALDNEERHVLHD